MNQTNDKEEMNHYMECRLGDSCSRCKHFMEWFLLDSLMTKADLEGI